MLRIPNEVLPGQVVEAADISAALRYAKAHRPARVPGSLIRTGSGGTSQYRILRPAVKQWPTTGAAPWPFKGYNTTVNTADVHTAQLQINGGDGSGASLTGGNTGIACVNGNRTDTKFGSPLAYPQLSITNNGYVYVKEILNADGTIDNTAGDGGTGVDVYFTESEGDMDPDTASPPTYGIKQIGTVTGYTTDGSGNISYQYNDLVGPVGITTSQVCFGTVIVT